MPFFGFLLMLTALVIAGVAGYFSVYGLANIYQGAFLSVVLMGGSLEVGKLIATSFLYRYWATTGWVLKTYLVAAILGLMLITSSGIFGYLSSAYQQDAVGIKDVQARIELLDKEYDELARRESEIDTDINRVGSNYVTARLNLMKQYAGEKNSITERRNVIRTEKLQLASKQLEVEAHTGPIIYIAKAMGKTIDEAVIWMSLLIIAVFDPLAIALTIAANSVMLQNKKTKKKEVEVEVVERVVEKEVEKLVEVPVEVHVERPIPPGKILVDEDEYQDLKTILDGTEATLHDAAEARAQLEIELEQRGDELRRLIAEKEALVEQLQEQINKDAEEDVAHSRLEVALQHQIDNLNRAIQATEGDLAVAISGLEKREAKIEVLERHNAELEQQIVDLRLQLRKFEMSATERARLHQQNVVDAKTS